MMAFEQYLAERAHFSADDVARITELAQPRSLRRNDVVLQPGEVCRHKIFVLDGLLRTYSMDNDGNEAILQFSPPYTWTLDVESYDKQTPSQYYIGAVEATEVLLWQKQHFQHLLNTIPQLSALAQGVISRNIYNNRRRMATLLNATPQQKYVEFAAEYPDLVNRVPLRMIAAYLGISIKTLTRLRHAMLQRS